MIKLYNTLTRRKEEFKPIKKGQVGIYSCGPTVYNYAHIGNLRAFVVADLLQRILKFNGLKVNWVMNITDVDDKTIRDSQKDYPDLAPKEALKKLTAKYEKTFWQDLARLNIQKPKHIPPATEFISQMQELITKIVQAGFAYEKDGSFYFDVAKYAQNFKYGQLVDLDLNQLRQGERMENDEYEKEALQDFALWKARKVGEPFWNFNWQGKNHPGRPGWHIECSAMSQEYLGIPFDIHTGGVDLRFPHHENEIAQSITGYGAKKLANFFVHNEHILVDGQKMAKSAGNFITQRDLDAKIASPPAQKFLPVAFRYFCLGTHYQKKLDFSWEGLRMAQESLFSLWFKIGEMKTGRGKILKNYLEEFISAINNNLDLPKAMTIAQEVIKTKEKDQDKRTTLLKFDEVLGLNLNVKPREVVLTGYIKEKIKQYEKARKEKKYQLSDRLRQEIDQNLSKLIPPLKISDTKEGTKIVKK